jgi:hypothetical protein
MGRKTIWVDPDSKGPWGDEYDYPVGDGVEISESYLLLALVIGTLFGFFLTLFLLYFLRMWIGMRWKVW